MTTTTYPVQEISRALDVLQDNGVISDNLADHELGCWMEERGLTCADLNAEPARASEAQQQRITRLIEMSFESDPRDAYVVLASLMTDCFESEKVADLIADYQDTMGLTDTDDLN